MGHPSFTNLLTPLPWRGSAATRRVGGRLDFDRLDLTFLSLEKGLFRSEATSSDNFARLPVMS